MENNNKKIAVKKVHYSFDMLRNDILTAPKEDNEKLQTGDKYLREYQSKLIVAQMLSYLAESYETKNYKDNELLRNAIETKVYGDEQLSGYLFFVSQNPQFEYLWNYMRKCRTKYIEFLVNSIRFLNNVLVDINLLAGMPWSGINIHVVFHNILDVELTYEKPFVKARLLWENFYHLVTVKSDYDIIVKANETLLTASNRKEPSDIKKLIDSVFEMVNNKSKKITENENA